MRDKVASRVEGLDPSLGMDLPALLALLDAPVDDPTWATLDPPRRRRRTLDALGRLVLRLSQERPLLLIFEDLHWIDSETQALLDELVDLLPAMSTALLVRYRPEYRYGWGGKSWYSQIRVDPLPEDGAAELLDLLLGTDPTLRPLADELTARTAGNPFFLEESVRSLVETGELTGERGAYRLVRPVEDVRVPATVQAVLAARIDRLVPGDKRLLQRAAVIGKDVSLTLLAQVAERTLQLGIISDHFCGAIALIEAYRLAGQPEEALQTAAQVIDLATKYGERGCLAQAVHTLARLYVDRDPPVADAAEQRYREARALADELEMRPLQAHCHLGPGHLYRRTGRFDEARAELSAAIEMLREMGMTFWLPEAEAELAQVTGSPAVS